MIYEGQNYKVVYEVTAQTKDYVAILIKEIYYQDMKLENFVFEAHSYGDLMRVTDEEEVIIKNSENLWRNFFSRFNHLCSDEGEFKVNSERMFVEKLFI